MLNQVTALIYISSENNDKAEKHVHVVYIKYILRLQQASE